MRNDNQLVSVVIPAYNVENYIEECIDSICHQTYEQLEIIVVDDGSMDSTGEVCDRLCTRDNRIRVIHKTNGGLSSARNAGIEDAKGGYICFIDGDDVLHPEFVVRLLETIIRYGLDSAYCRYEKFTDKISFDENSQPEVTEYDRNDMLMILSDVRNKERALATIVCNKLYRINIFDDLRFIEGRIHEDEFIIHKLMGKCSKIGYLDYAGYCYRARTDSITGNWSNYSIKHLDVIDAYADRLEYIKKTGDDELIRKMSVSMCEIILMEYISFWENGSLKNKSSDAAVTMDKYLRKYMKKILAAEFRHLSPRTVLKYLHFIFSPKSFYKEYWNRDISMPIETNWKKEHRL